MILLSLIWIKKVCNITKKICVCVFEEKACWCGVTSSVLMKWTVELIYAQRRYIVYEKINMMNVHDCRNCFNTDNNDYNLKSLLILLIICDGT